MTQPVKYFVVSLPRTGTKSLCKMASVCGLNISHAPGVAFQSRFNSTHTFFADTPVYRQGVISYIIDNAKAFEPKFIYIEKDYKKTFESWKKVKLYHNYLAMLKSEQLSRHQIFDVESYNEAFSNVQLDENNCEELFDKHRKEITSIISNAGKHMLIYNFEQGWAPFCEFINSSIPNEPLPHLNVNTMFEKL